MSIYYPARCKVGSYMSVAQCLVAQMQCVMQCIVSRVKMIEVT